jgi:hypothetical protein
MMTRTVMTALLYAILIVTLAVNFAMAATAGPADYHTTSHDVKVRVGAAVSNLEVHYTPLEACEDPTTCNPVSSIPAFWRCNIPGCTDPDWTGSVISWPSWSAYEDNDRTGSQSRTVFSSEGELLYPYMGSWAEGCQVTAISGTVLIIEWQRGTDVWRETFLEPGQSHTIALTFPEDGALIEGLFSPGFSVSLANCSPQSIDKTPTPTPTPTDTPTPTPTNTPTPTPTDTSTPTPTDTPTPTPTDTSTATPTNTPTATPTDTPTATPTATPALIYLPVVLKTQVPSN